MFKFKENELCFIRAAPGFLNPSKATLCKVIKLPPKNAPIYEIIYTLKIVCKRHTDYQNQRISGWKIPRSIENGEFECHEDNMRKLREQQ